jgi:hypothetical protein
LKPIADAVGFLFLSLPLEPVSQPGPGVYRDQIPNKIYDI